MDVSLIQWSLLLTVIVVEILILLTLIRRRLRSRVPIFFNYALFGLVAFVLELGFPRVLSRVQYFYFYWVIEALGMLISLAVIYEVFLLILRPYSALMDFGKVLFGWAVLFLTLASVVTALVTVGSQTSKICAAIVLFQRVVQLMQCGFLLLLLVFESRLGLSWRSLGMSIALGMGGYAALDLCMSYLRQHFPSWAVYLNLATVLISLGILSMWLVVFLLPEPEHRTVQDSPGRLILQRWNEALMATPLVSRRNQIAALSPVESFLPGVEATVERVMARKMH